MGVHIFKKNPPPSPSKVVLHGWPPDIINDSLENFLRQEMLIKKPTCSKSDPLGLQKNDFFNQEDSRHTPTQCFVRGSVTKPFVYKKRAIVLVPIVIFSTVERHVTRFFQDEQQTYYMHYAMENKFRKSIIFK